MKSIYHLRKQSLELCWGAGYCDSNGFKGLCPTYLCKVSYRDVDWTLIEAYCF
jgi:hypothetical protein